MSRDVAFGSCTLARPLSRGIRHVDTEMSEGNKVPGTLTLPMPDLQPAFDVGEQQMIPN